MEFKDAEILVVKVGTSTLTYDNGKVNLHRLEELCRTLSDLQNSGKKLVLVSSGAIGVGVGKLGLFKRPEETEKKQALAAVGVVLVVTGYLILGTVVEAKFLFPFGFVYEGFTSSDFFPILPHLGWYMLGTVLGRTVYADKKTRLPGTFRESAIARFFCWCGRQSLFIYLLHQPVVYGLLELIAALK